MGLNQSFITEWDNQPKTTVNFPHDCSHDAVINSFNMLSDHKIPTIPDFQWACYEAAKLFKAMPNHVEVSVDVTDRVIFIGDMHGCFETMIRLFKGTQSIEPLGYPGDTVNGKRNVYLFNGDLVDRGGSGYQIVFAICLLKMMAPNCVFVNRGNHESEMFGMSTEPGMGNKFLLEVRDKFPAVPSSEYKPPVVELFTALPICHTFDKGIFVVHGGVPAANDMSMISLPQQSPFQMARPAISVSYTGSLTPFDLLEFQSADRFSVRDFEDSPKSKRSSWHSFVWSYDRLPYMAAFMAHNGIHSLVCSHTATPYHFVTTFTPSKATAEGWAMQALANCEDKHVQMRDFYQQHPEMFAGAVHAVEVFSSPTNNGQLFAIVIEAREGQEGERLETNPYLWGYHLIGAATEFKFIQAEGEPQFK